MRLLFCSISLFVCMTAAQAQSPKAVMDYVEKYKKIAIEEMKVTGIPASVTLAQGIHESGCGCSALALNSNNHFGIKCHNEWTGVTYHHDDDQPQECFRVYTCPEESFKDHSDFLKTRPRYSFLFKLEPTDYRGWAKGLKAAGYATNPKYHEIIIKLIEDYKLNEFDKGIDRPATASAQMADATNPKTAVLAVVSVDASKSTVRKAQAAEAPKPNVTPHYTPAPQPANNIDLAKIQLDERLINGSKAVIYTHSIPVASIARKYGLTVDELYSYNDMMPNVKFKDGEYVYLEKKKAETTYYQYEIAAGETMRDVAQKFGIQMPELYKRNGITMDSEPLTGEIIVLRGTREVPLHFRVVDRGTPKRSTAETPALPTSDTKYHKVNDSDTVYSISRQYNIPVDDLIKINGLKDNDIKIGQTLVITSL